MKFTKALVAAASLLALMPVTAYAAWGAADDEANRQRMMNSMRQQQADNDRRSFERQQQQQQSMYNKNLERPSGGGSSSSGGSSSGGAFNSYQREDPVDTGPQSVVKSYRFVIYVKETEAQTIARLEKEATSGNMLSQFNLGRIYYTGYATTRDDAKARKWFGAAAKQGHIPSAAQYGMMNMNAQGGPADRAEGMKYLKIATDKGDTYAMSLYGFFLLDERKFEEGLRMPEAVALLTRAADGGEVIAQAALGRFVYYLGVGAPLDADLAVKYLKLAAENGDPGSMDDLGELYMGGSNGLVKQNTKEGLRLIKASADGGFARAQYIYGLMLLQGKLVPLDAPTGLSYVKKAAENGHADGQYIYADCLYFGTGTAKNVVESARWYGKAAAQGHKESIEIMKEPEMIEAAKKLS
ncbi:tetratricopeptide repeat protein [Asticcacaulis sp. YBE204]|uniref:tetratricopeptide repeat protein n=1 Tax=Asticcacaulis sp. YBE204 TaxID=1282363 RepID=UPI0003C3DB85|nr:SEL1-like repeat protein [Asticcacaulis sp. YBE204]ESQ79986.1 hypothetical protein AEYBE204_09055 [Asticcacaulis sp. YBE204]